jgi:hypothetical protein
MNGMEKAAGCGVQLIHIGSPEAPDPDYVCDSLREYVSDRRLAVPLRALPPQST